MKQKRISLLDCTLRDGGFALEDADKNGIKTDVFTEKQLNDLAESVVNSGAEIIELGAIEATTDDKKGFAIYQSMEEISFVMPDKKFKEQLFAGLYRGPDVDLATIPDWRSGLCEIARVILRYSELVKSLDFCEGLCKKGYKVCLQPMVTVRYTDEELNLVLDRANAMGAFAAYFVDSYGYMTPKDIEYYYRKYDSKLAPQIRIGFHAHNNMEMAFSNVVRFLEISGACTADRNVIVDSCATGMGQGTGNAQSEVVMNYLNNCYGKSYDLNEMFKACELVDMFNVDHLWGYSATRFIPAMNKTAYKYALALKNKFGMSLSEINSVLCKMPEDLRYRYTPDNTKSLLQRVKG